MSESRQCLMVGYYGAENLGDELILKVIGGWIQHTGFQVCALSHNPAASTQDHPDFRFVPYGDLDALFAIVRDCEVVLLGGGGPLHEYNRLNPVDLPVFPGREGSIYVQPLMLAHQCGLPIGLLAQGVGPLVSAGAKTLVRQLFESADIATVRSESAFHILEEIGLDKKPAVYPDPGWLGMPCKMHARADQPLLVIEVRNWPFEEGWKWRLAVGIFEIFISKGWRIRYCCFGGGADFDQARHVAKFYGDPSPDVVTASINEADLPFQGAHRAITMRFHAAIAAAGAGVPLCMLAYDEKVSSLHRQLKLDEGLHIPISAPEVQYLRAFEVLRDVDAAPDQNLVAELRRSALGHRVALEEALAQFKGRTIVVAPEDTSYGKALLNSVGGDSVDRSL